MTREEMIDEAVRRAWGLSRDDDAKPILVKIGNGYETRFYPENVAQEFFHIFEYVTRIAAREAER